jgi:hypothetical protein
MRKEPSLRVGQQSNNVLSRGNIYAFVVWCFVPLVLMVLFNACASTKVVTPLPWQQKQIAIDGATTDWETPLKFHTKDAKVQYGLANDSENLYFCLMASDDQTQMKLLLNGLELAIDTVGGKKKHVVVKFPLADDKKTGSGPSDKMEIPDITKMRIKLLSEVKEIELKGFRSSVGNGRLPIENTSSIEIKINWDSYNILVYELKIPFSIFLLKKKMNKEIGISWNIKGMPLPQMPSGMPSGGMPSGGMPRGGMAPPAGGMPEGIDRSLFESESAYLKVNLASK